MSERCRICAKVEEIVARRDDVDMAYVLGLAFGFNIRRDTTFMLLCERHEQLLSTKLKEAGSTPVNLTRGGSS